MEGDRRGRKRKGKGEYTKELAPLFIKADMSHWVCGRLKRASFICLILNVSLQTQEVSILPFKYNGKKRPLWQ